MWSYKSRNNGAVPFFGKLTGFKFVRCLDYFQFDEQGRLVEHVENRSERDARGFLFDESQ